MEHVFTTWQPTALPVPPAFVAAGGQRSRSSGIISGWYSGCFSGHQHDGRPGGSQRLLMIQTRTTTPTPVMSSTSRWLSSPFSSVGREEGDRSGDRRRRTSRVRNRDDGAVCDGSRVVTADPERIREERNNFRALLDILGLEESDVLPELSKKSQALLHIVQGGEGEREELLPDAAAEADRCWAPWVLLDEVNMGKEEVAKVVVRYPILLATKAEDARAVVRWLRERAGLSPRQVVKIVKSHPKVLRYDVDEQLEPHVVWLEGVGLTKEGVAKVIAKVPQMIGINIEDNLDVKTTWLREYLGINEAGVACMLRAFPTILALSSENMQEKVHWLEKRLAVDRETVARIVRVYPSLFGSSVETCLEPKLEWLRDGLGLGEEDLGAVIRMCPSILGYSIEDNLEPTVNWLRKRLGLNMKAVASMVRIFPPILGLSPEKNLEAKLTWLRKNLDLDEEHVVVLVKTCPPLFGCSAESNLGPTLEFFRHGLGGSKEDIRAQVLRNPTLLRYSLNKRMIPRAAAIESAGLGKPIFRDHVKAVAAYTGAAFDKWLDSEILERGLPPRTRTGD